MRSDCGAVYAVYAIYSSLDVQTAPTRRLKISSSLTDFFLTCIRLLYQTDTQERDQSNAAAALVDFLLYRTLLSPAAAAGCALICVGFVALAVSEHRAKRKAAAAGAVMAAAALD